MRRLARELALQILFQTEFSPNISKSQFLELFEQQFDAETLKYADYLAQGVEQNKDEIDSLIQTTARHWRLERIALVDKNILRVAIFEMKYSLEKLQPQIAINEALEISKKFSNIDSPSFINGILDTISKGA